MNGFSESILQLKTVGISRGETNSSLYLVKEQKYKICHKIFKKTFQSLFLMIT